MVNRPDYLASLEACFRTFPAVAVLGPRQCGKSTLAREFLRAHGRGSVLFDLERPSDLARLRAAPEEDLGHLQEVRGTICIDEVQRAPELFPLLRVLLDARGRRARYLLLGSASFHLVRGISESLAGRVGFLDLTPFHASEVKAASGRARLRAWWRGGLPRSLLARSDRASAEWRESYLRTFLEQDVPGLGFRLPAATLRRFWTMLAHLHGGILNATELAAGLGMSVPTVGRYLDLLEGTFMVRRLPPFQANLGKRLVKAPRIYVRDTGILHSLLEVPGADALRAHPKVGASWEGWVIEQTLGALTLAGESARASFWRTHGGAETDLVLELRGRTVPVEIKLGGEPRVTRGLVECRKDLASPAGIVLHGGPASFPLGNGFWALSAELLAEPRRLRDALLRPESATG